MVSLWMHDQRKTENENKNEKTGEKTKTISKLDAYIQYGLINNMTTYVPNIGEIKSMLFTGHFF